MRSVEVLVVDGSPSDVFAAHRAVWSELRLRHLSPDADLRCLNGKVAGVLTGLRCATAERVVIADDDVRWDDAGLRRAAALLDEAELVRPQNYFDPVPWHACWDTSRTLVNRALGADYPGTLAVRRSVVLDAGGYDGDVLFENLELIRTVRRVGGRERNAVDLYVARRPPSLRRFLSQRVRQAYDDFALPARMAIALSLLPTATWLCVSHHTAVLAVRAALGIGLAELGRRRSGGASVFPVAASALAPLWIGERAVCAWLAVASRCVLGGCHYRGQVIRRAASSSSAPGRPGTTCSVGVGGRARP
jgi:hypothetical protein